MPTSPFVSAPPAWDAVSAIGIGGLAVAVAAIVLGLVARYDPPRRVTATVAVVTWMALMAALALAGVLSNGERRPPPMAILVPLIFVLGFAIGLSPLGGRLAQAPLGTLVGLQMFRLPLELVMHHAGEVGIMPPELSFGGYNFDIVTGAGALIVWLAMRATTVPRALIWTWNLWGFGCLLVIAAIARATSPMVRAFGDDPRHINTWVMYFPYIWLPAVLVVIAVAGHVIVTRALLPRPGRTGVTS